MLIKLAEDMHNKSKYNGEKIQIKFNKISKNLMSLSISRMWEIRNML